MLIKAITLFCLRAVGDFLFVFCSLINIDEAPVCHFKTKYWHTIKTWTVFKWIISKPAVFTCFVCIWSFERAEAQSLHCLSVLERAAQALTHISACGNSISCVDFTFNVLLSNMSSNLATVKTAFYNNRQTIDLILTFSFGQGGTNVHRCEGKKVVLEETRL